MASILESVHNLLPTKWDDRRREENALVELGKYSSEFESIKSKMRPHTPTRICRIENPHLWGFYQLKKEECTKRYQSTVEKELWHVTSPTVINSIATENFNWRLSNRAKYGQGVCFSPDLDHAKRYSTHNGAVILAKVLVGQKSGSASYGTEIPLASCDTTTGWCGNVYVKYMDNEFYPEYVAYF